MWNIIFYRIHEKLLKENESSVYKSFLIQFESNEKWVRNV